MNFSRKGFRARDDLQFLTSMYRNEQYPNEEVKFVAGKFFSNHNTNFDLIFILNITSLHSDRYCDVRHKLVHIKNS